MPLPSSSMGLLISGAEAFRESARAGHCGPAPHAAYTLLFFKPFLCLSELLFCNTGGVLGMAFNGINSLCKKKKIVCCYSPFKFAYGGLQQSRKETTADLQLGSFWEGPIQAWHFTLSFSRCHLMKFYKLSVRGVK